MDEFETKSKSEAKPKAKSKPTNYEIIYKIIEDNGKSMTLDEIIEAFKKLNPKKENYNYKATVRNALKDKVGVADLGSETYCLSRSLYNGRSFRIRPDEEKLKSGLPLTIVPECGCLALSVLTERKKDATFVCDKKSKRYYRLGFFNEPGLMRIARMTGLDPWYYEVGFKIGDEFILTCVDIVERRFNIEHVPAAKRKKAEVKAVDKELASMGYELIKEGKVDAKLSEYLGYFTKDILNAMLIAGTHEDDIVPSPIDDILTFDKRLIVKDSMHVFIKTDYERIYPDDDFESLETRFKKYLGESLEYLEGEGYYDEDDLDDFDDDLTEEGEKLHELLDLASCVAMAKNQKQAVKEWAAGEPKEFVKATADMVEQMWNEVPRPELGFRSLGEVSQNPGPDTGYIRNAGIIAVDFEKGKKVGRNDACTCGSGKKYKKCCMAKNQDDIGKHDIEKTLVSKGGMNPAGGTSISDIINSAVGINKDGSKKDHDKYPDPELEKFFINLMIVENMVSDMHDYELDAIDLNICRPCYRFLIACQYRQEGKVAKAIDILLALVRSEGEDPGLEYTLVYEELANCAIDKGELDAALHWIELAIAYDQKFEDGIREDDLQEKLAEIRAAAGSSMIAKRTGSSFPPTGVPVDRRAMEKTMADLTRFMNEQNFETHDEANAFLKELMESGEIDNIGNSPLLSNYKKTPVTEAQDLMYKAWDSRGKKRIELAKKALKISPDCADAYVLLAQETAKTLEEAKDLYEKGVKAGERALGPQAFVDDVGHFWGILETRPYMRARQGLAECLRLLGDKNQAIEHFFDMLRLNPNDNQGIREKLTTYLLEDGRDADCEKLLNQYKGDGTAHWMYNYALLMYRKSIAIEKTGKQDKTMRKADVNLKKAIEYNPHVPKYLLGKKRLPKEPPEFIGFGDENEAIAYVYDAAIAWSATEGAIKWIQDNCR